MSQNFEMEGLKAKLEKCKQSVAAYEGVIRKLVKDKKGGRKRKTRRRKHRGGAVSLEFEKPETASGNSIRQIVLIKQGVDREVAQKIVKAIKSSKSKVQTSIQGDEVRVSGKKRDDLQAAIKLIKELNIKHPLQYENFRD